MTFSRTLKSCSATPDKGVGFVFQNERLTPGVFAGELLLLKTVGFNLEMCPNFITLKAHAQPWEFYRSDTNGGVIVFSFNFMAVLILK
jgi:hypothetical protein